MAPITDDEMAPRTPSGPPPPEATADRDLDVRAIVLFGVGLAVTLVVVAALMYLLSVFLREAIGERDPEPPALPEVRETRLPPQPRLQASPRVDLERLRAEQERLLSTYAWIDRGGDRETGRARIPIERAMDILAERGLPSRRPAPPEGGAR